MTSSDLCWYRPVGTSEGLQQGQLLFGFTVEEVSEETTSGIDVGEEASITVERTGTFIIATNSCDIEHQDMPLLLVAVATADGIGKSKLSSAGKGHRPLQFLLPPHKPFGVEGFLLCSFGDMVVVPKKKAADFVLAAEVVELNWPEDSSGQYRSTARTVVLASPYREHFSQALGNVFSRVSLEENTWERGDFPQ